MTNCIRAAVIGCFIGENGVLSLTPMGKMLDGKLSGKLLRNLIQSNFSSEVKKVRVFTGLAEEYPCIVVTGLGDESVGYSTVEEIDLKKENVRVAIGEAVKACKEYSAKEIFVDDCTDPKSVGEALRLCTQKTDHWKSKKSDSELKYTLAEDQNPKASLEEFMEGMTLGSAQAFAAYLAETPANLKAPRVFAKIVQESMPSNVLCVVRDKKWIEEHKMGLFLSVNQGSVEPPVLLEAHYKGSDDAPIILVGKGIIFDTGGISIKPADRMSEMKADMNGAAVVFAAVKAVAELKLPIHVIGISPLTENMPSGSATRPGDVYTSMLGKTVVIENTDAEGRLVLADALAYADTLSPSEVINLATLTGAVGVALGSATSAIYSTNDNMVSLFKEAAATTGDRVWRMPLFREYLSLIESHVADLSNLSKKREAGSCTAAMFLKQFIQTPNWAHLDIAGTMSNDGDISYIPKGMSGRPARTLIEYLKLKALKNQ